MVLIGANVLLSVVQDDPAYMIWSQQQLDGAGWRWLVAVNAAISGKSPRDGANWLSFDARHRILDKTSNSRS